MTQLQAAWANGSYESMWLGNLRAQVDGRYFPLSDHHIRGFCIIGEADRCLQLFRSLYNNNPNEFMLGSLSNMMFMALGCETIPHKFISSLSAHIDKLARSSFSEDSVNTVLPQRLEVHERPLMVVVSSDLRNHPVGRFWLPIARHLRSCFRVIYAAGNPRDYDPIRSELRELSDEWWPLEASEVSSTAAKIRSCSPSLLLDLGGHTADNHPELLSHRLASVQATYLGFYGPSYARFCDWWIVDHVLKPWLVNSYPESEKMWALPGSSLCYVPSLHGLPDIDDIYYQEPNHLVFGSFNHTCLLYTSPSPRDRQKSRMPSSA